MGSLYETLGVAEDADAKQIRSAYKKKAKQEHPDTGGTQEKFGRLKKAHDILVDPERRAKYDATGDEAEVAPDNTAALILGIISAALAQVLQVCAQNKRSPLQTELIFKIRGRIKQHLTEACQQQGVLRPIMAGDAKLADRFKSEKEGENIFEQILRGRLETLRTQYEQLEGQIKLGEEALKILEDYTFKNDASEPLNNLGFNFTTSTWA